MTSFIFYLFGVLTGFVIGLATYEKINDLTKK